MRSHNRLVPISFSLAVLLSPLGLIPAASAIPNPIDNGNKQERLPDVPPTRRPPDGNRSPGGGLDGTPTLCPTKPQALTAITPIDVHGNTLSGHPTFWFYMPYTAGEVKGGEFSVLTEGEDERVYKTSFTLPDQPGLVSITLPADEAASLQPGEYYHWYLNLYCVSTTESKTDLNIDGWVQRVEATPEREEQVRNTSPDIWYDVINRLALQQQTSPDNGADGVAQAWAELLESVELDEFIQAPVVGPVLLSEP